MKQHHLRPILSGELHTRPFHDFEGTGRFIRFIYLAGAEEAYLFEQINRWLAQQGMAVITSDEKFRRESRDGFALRIERHSEFVTISFIDHDQASKPLRAGALASGAFDAASFPHLPFSLIEEIKQPVFHAIWLEIAGKPPRKISPDKVAELLHCRTAASSVISGGAGQVHYSFDNDEKGFSRALLFNDSISPSRMGRVILRMVELETYRMLALLGLPVIRQYGAEVSGIETQLKNLTSAISALISDASEQAGSLLPQLSSLAAQIETISAETSFRLSATNAYQEVFYARMERLNISRLDGHQGLYGFIDRRMMPALQTCSAFSRRLEDLSRRVERTGSLLRTHAEYVIQNQNTALLTSMNSRAQAQYRLQQTVEGLSVIAGTYYGVGLVGVLAKLLPSHILQNISVDMIKAISVPFVAILIAFILRRGTHLAKKLTS